MVLCACGKNSHPCYGTRCEDCWAEGQYFQRPGDNVHYGKNGWYVHKTAFNKEGRCLVKPGVDKGGN